MADPLQDLGRWVERQSGAGLVDYVKNLQGKIIAAGMEDNTNAHKMLGIQVISSLIVPVVVVFIMRNLGMGQGLFRSPAQVLLYLGLIGFGFYFPAMNINERIAKRHKHIFLRLPDMIDLLTISVEAGLDFMGALERVVSKSPQGPLREEVEYFFKQVELGKTRQDALKQLGNRVQLPELSTICSSLIQADRLGTSIGPILRIQSDILRSRRSQRAETQAMEAPVKMLMPLLMCIFPAVFIMLFAPIFIDMIRNLTASG
jgi:tight adherence protein C